MTPSTTRNVVKYYVMKKIQKFVGRRKGRLIADDDHTATACAVAFYAEEFESIMMKDQRVRTSMNATSAPGMVTSDLKVLSRMALNCPLKPMTIDGEVVAYEDDHIEWGHIFGFLILAGELAVKSVQATDRLDQVDTIVDFVSDLYDSELSQWIDLHGGWEKMVEWKKKGYGAKIWKATSAGLWSVTNAVWGWGSAMYSATQYLLSDWSQYSPF